MGREEGSLTSKKINQNNKNTSKNKLITDLKLFKKIKCLSVKFQLSVRRQIKSNYYNNKWAIHAKIKNKLAKKHITSNDAHAGVLIIIIINNTHVWKNR